MLFRSPPGHRTHLPNANAPSSVAPHKHSGPPSISQRGKPNTSPPSEEDNHNSKVHTNPPVSGYVPSKSLPSIPLRKPIDEKLYIERKHTQGRTATHETYLQYLRNNGIVDTTPHLSTQIQVHNNAKGTQSLQKGHSDNEYSQITANQLRKELGMDPTGMDTPDTNVSATM